LAYLEFWLAYLVFCWRTWFLVGAISVLFIVISVLVCLFGILVGFGFLVGVLSFLDGILSFLAGVIDAFDIGMLFVLFCIRYGVHGTLCVIFSTALSMEKGTLAGKKYTTAGCGG
jgi:hypothetical protein